MRVMIRLNEAQVAHIAEVLGNLSLIFFAALVLPIWTTRTQPVLDAVIGVILAFGSALTSIMILKEVTL